MFVQPGVLISYIYSMIDICGSEAIYIFLIYRKDERARVYIYFKEQLLSKLLPIGQMQGRQEGGGGQNTWGPECSKGPGNLNFLEVIRW
jgi:hypothetical protein